MSKVRDLPEQTTPEDTDLLYTVDDSEGVNGGKKIKLSTLRDYAGQDLNEHLDGAPSKHDASEVDYERNDLEKTDVQIISDSIDTAIDDLDDKKLSTDGNNSMNADLDMGGNDINNVNLINGVDILSLSSSNGLNSDIIINSLDDFPTPVAGVITLESNKNYVIGGNINIGTNRIVFSEKNSINGKNPEFDKIIYTGTDTMFTVLNNDFILNRIGIECSQGTFVNATNINYSINPAVDSFQGRNKRFAIIFCNLIGGAIGGGSILGECEGFATINFNGNLITSWDDGFKVSNGLSFEALNNKSVLWNGQGNSMIILRDNNWSGQVGGVGSYIPTGFNALNFNGNVLHPRTSDYAVFIEQGHSSREGNVSGNIFITTGITTGGVFDPNSLTYNDLPEYNIQGNQGIQDNVPTIQATIDNFTSVTTVINAVNTPVKLNFNNTIKTSQNLLFSSRILVSSTTGFQENQIITGGTSGYTARIQSIDLANNYLYVEYVVDAMGNNQYFTVGESLSSTTASATYNGVDGSFKYYGNKDISIRFVASMSLQKQQNGADLFSVIPYLNGSADSNTAAFIELDIGIPLQVTVQDIQNISSGDVIELYIENKGSADNVICQSIVWNLSGR